MPMSCQMPSAVLSAVPAKHTPHVGDKWAEQRDLPAQYELQTHTQQHAQRRTWLVGAFGTARAEPTGGDDSSAAVGAASTTGTKGPDGLNDGSTEAGCLP